MRRKNRKWVGLAVILYLGVMWSAYRWAIDQRVPEGNIFVRIEREGVRRLAEERAQQEKNPPKPTGESRLAAAGPAYIAARYDETHVVFIVSTNTESRFSSSSPLMRSATPTKVSAPARPVAPLAGLQELWEPDSQSLHFFPKIIQTTHPGDRWTLSVSPQLTIPVFIERPIIAPTGCQLALGFLASIPQDQLSAFGVAPSDYFAVRRTAVEPADPQVHSRIAELSAPKIPASTAKQIEHQLTERMKQELAAIDTGLIANAGSPGATANDVSPANPLPHLKEWLHADRALAAGEGKLDFDVHSYLLTPDSVPRLFVRARWTLAGAPVFLMTAWFKDSPNSNSPPDTKPVSDAQPTLLFADTSWSKSLREGDAPGSLGDTLDFQTVLNQFDADQDGWAELLIHSYQGSSTSLALYLYTDKALAPMKTPLTRDTQSPESCVDP